MWGNKKLRLESIKIQSGYETDLSPQTKNPTNVEHDLDRYSNCF